jgi:hypothetical protein
MRTPLKDIRLNLATIVCDIRTDGLVLKAEQGLTLTYDTDLEAVICERPGYVAEIVPVHAVSKMRPEMWPPGGEQLVAPEIKSHMQQPYDCVVENPEACVCGEPEAATPDTPTFAPSIMAGRNGHGEYGVTIPEGTTKAVIKLEAPTEEQRAKTQNEIANETMATSATPDVCQPQPPVDRPVETPSPDVMSTPADPPRRRRGRR